MSVCVLCVEGGSVVSKTQMPDLIVRCEQVPDVILLAFDYALPEFQVVRIKRFEYFFISRHVLVLPLYDS